MALRMRRAVRAVVLDPGGRILLVRFEFPDRVVWACPGGGIEQDETEHATIRRELAEEAGLTNPDIGPCIWLREHVIPLFGGRWDGQVERFYLVRSDGAEPRPLLSAEQLRAEYVTDVRWWTPTEVAAAGDVFAPRRLPELVAALLRDEIPDPPIEVGV